MLKGLGGLGDMASMMKAATEMQARYTRVQEQLAQVEVVGDAGGGLVKVRANAKGEVLGLEIDPSILVASEKEVAEDLILAAMKDAQAKGRERTEKRMAKLAENMGVPPGVKLPF